jgi:hypothetical protein
MLRQIHFSRGIILELVRSACAIFGRAPLLMPGRDTSNQGRGNSPFVTRNAEKITRHFQPAGRPSRPVGRGRSPRVDGARRHELPLRLLKILIYLITQGQAQRCRSSASDSVAAYG